MSCVPLLTLAVQRTSWHNYPELLLCSMVSNDFNSSVPLFCSLSESFFMVKGAALFLQQGSSHQGQKAHPHHKHAGENHKAQHSKSPCCYPHHLPKFISLISRQTFRPGYLEHLCDELMCCTLQQMFVAQVRRMEAASLMSMFQTYSLGRLVFKSLHGSTVSKTSVVNQRRPLFALPRVSFHLSLLSKECIR